MGGSYESSDWAAYQREFVKDAPGSQNFDDEVRGREGAPYTFENKIPTLSLKIAAIRVGH
jgi:hypothetical protein